jgi:hypothetical protein
VRDFRSQTVEDEKMIKIWRACVAWGKGLHRDAALDSLRNVLAVVGGATILADFTTIKVWLILPMLGLAFLIWLLDYERHFRGQTVDEAKVTPMTFRGGEPSGQPLSMKTSTPLAGTLFYTARPAAAPEAQAH